MYYNETTTFFMNMNKNIIFMLKLKALFHNI